MSAPWSSRAQRGIRTWLVAAATLTLIALTSGATWEHRARARALREAPAWGRLIDVGNGRRVQLDCRGTGSPTVVLESGLDIYGSLAWVAVHDSLAETTRVCAYSRAGIMWSDAGSSSFDADASAQSLHALLASAGEAPPYVMVGHSIGGPYVLAFTARYPGEVKSLVMVDASHPDQFPAYERAVGKSIAPTATMPRVGAALSWTGLVRIAAAGGEPASWPDATRRIAPAFLPTSVGAIAAEVAAVPATLARASSATSLGDRPLVVLHATGPKTLAELAQIGISAVQGTRLDSVRLALASSMAAWSTRGRLVQVRNTSHYIQFDRPDAVIAAVRAVAR